jgi:sporulation protein YtfJ
VNPLLKNAHNHPHMPNTKKRGVIMEKHVIVDLMGTTMQNINEMVDVNTIVGQPVSTPDGTTVIPVSKVSFGFSAGGGEYGAKEAGAGKNFGGGSGAGVSISPVAFLVISPGGVKLLPVAPPAGNTVDRLVETIPSLVDKLGSMFRKGKEKEEDEE